VQIDDLSPKSRDVVPAETATSPLDGPFVVRVKKRECPKKDRLARARRAGQGKSVARANRDTDAA